MDVNNTIDSASQIKPEQYLWGISTNVLLMGLVSFFTDISSEMITAVMPFFILTISGVFALGIIDGISNAIANIIKGISGYLSDKIKRRKPFVILGYAISNFTKPFIGFQSQWGYVLLLKITDRIGKGIRVAPRDALISYYVDKSEIDFQSTQSRSGLNFGIHRSMDTLGAVMGAFLASFLLFIQFSYQQVIIWSILPGAIAIIVLIFVKDVKESDIIQLKSITVPLPNDITKPTQTRSDHLTPQIKRLIWILSLMEFASVDIAFVMVRASDILSPQFVILLYTGFNIIYALLATPAGKLADRFGKQRIVTIGLIILLVISISLIFPLESIGSGSIIMIILFLLFGIYMAIVDTGSKAFVSDVTGKNKKGRIYGLYYLLVGILSIVESTLFGFLYYAFGYYVAFGFSSVLLLICTIIFATANFTIPKDSIPKEEQEKK